MSGFPKVPKLAKSPKRQHRQSIDTIPKWKDTCFSSDEGGWRSNMSKIEATVMDLPNYLLNVKRSDFCSFEIKIDRFLIVGTMRLDWERVTNPEVQKKISQRSNECRRAHTPKLGWTTRTSSSMKKQKDIGEKKTWYPWCTSEDRSWILKNPIFSRLTFLKTILLYCG